MSFDETPLAPSESWSVINDKRGTFSIEWRPKLPLDNQSWPISNKGELELYFTVAPDDIRVLTVNEKKRQYSATGKVVRRYIGPILGYNNGDFQYRYVLKLTRREGK